jgi:hypothetical protein
LCKMLQHLTEMLEHFLWRAEATEEAMAGVRRRTKARTSGPRPAAHRRPTSGAAVDELAPRGALR